MHWWGTSRPRAKRRHGASGAERMTFRAAHVAQATFLASDIAFDEAREHLAHDPGQRGKSAEAIHAALE
jgi:hypothetical protein